MNIFYQYIYQKQRTLPKCSVSRTSSNRVTWSQLKIHISHKKVVQPCIVCYIILFKMFIAPIHRLEGYYNFVQTENVCNRQNGESSTPQRIYMFLININRQIDMFVCLSIRMKI